MLIIRPRFCLEGAVGGDWGKPWLSQAAFEFTRRPLPRPGRGRLGFSDLKVFGLRVEGSGYRWLTRESNRVRSRAYVET